MHVARIRKLPLRSRARSLFTGLIVLTSAAALLSGCGGSSTKTVSVSSAPVPRTTSSTSSTTSSVRSSTTSTTSTSAQGSVAPNGGTQASGTHTASAPAFVQQEGHEGALKSALGVLESAGYTANNTSDYHPNQTLRVLVGTRTPSADGYEQRAFFFIDGKYLGTDSSSPSAGVKVISQGDTQVTLGYPLYKPGEAMCCGTGGEADVRFELNDGKLVPLDPIPPVESKTAPSRR